MSLAVAAGVLVGLPSVAQEAPGAIEIGGRKVLTLVSNDPPGVRCNNNIQVAAELANAYKVPILVYPESGLLMNPKVSGTFEALKHPAGSPDGRLPDEHRK